MDLFSQCAHGYVAMTCPQCRAGNHGRGAFTPNMVAPVQPERSHYSGASRATREYLAASWDDIMARAEDQVTRSSIRDGIRTGALIRRPVEVD